jgi:hypothetical protein
MADPQRMALGLADGASFQGAFAGFDVDPAHPHRLLQIVQGASGSLAIHVEIADFANVPADLKIGDKLVINAQAWERLSALGKIEVRAQVGVDADLPPWVIYCPEEYQCSDDGAGYWSDTDGWTVLEGASRYWEEPRGPLPNGRGHGQALHVGAMRDYRLVVRERDCSEDSGMLFRCLADSLEHAIEQALDMYPGCTPLGLDAAGVDKPFALNELYALWDALGRTPVDAGGRLLEDWLHFQAGASKEDVWRWFESVNVEFVVGEVMEGRRRPADLSARPCGSVIRRDSTPRLDSIMSNDLEKLHLATTALRDIEMGWPHQELGATHGRGLRALLSELALYLDGRGALSAEDRGALAEALPGIQWMKAWEENPPLAAATRPRG